MNGKTAKLLRKLARQEGADVRSIKKNYRRLNRHDRAGVKSAITQRTAK